MHKSTAMMTSLLFALILGVAPALAAVPSFDDLDRDGNGYISSSEAAALPCLAENFNRIDTESDEGLNRREFQQAVAQYCQRAGIE